jgi:hypothetical protein
MEAAVLIWGELRRLKRGVLNGTWSKQKLQNPAAVLKGTS